MVRATVLYITKLQTANTLLILCFFSQPPPTIRVNKDETDLGTSPFGVQLKSRGSTKGTSSPKRTPEPSGPEFSKVNLKKTDSSENRIKPNSNKSPGFLKVNNNSCLVYNTA